jgi:hypothetical protein
MMLLGDLDDQQVPRGLDCADPVTQRDVAPTSARPGGLAAAPRQEREFMKRICVPSLIAAAGVALVGLAVMAESARAAPLSFSFTFTNAAASGGVITGVVEGLSDNTSNQQASSLRVLSNTSGFGVGEYIGNPTNNLWSVSNGFIVFGRFEIFGLQNSSPAVTGASMLLQFNDDIIAGLTLTRANLNNSPNSVILVGGEDIAFAPVPIPAALPLFATGVAAVTYAGRRKRKAAHAT